VCTRQAARTSASSRLDIVAIIRPIGIRSDWVRSTGSDTDNCTSFVMPKPSIVLKTCSLSASARRAPIHAWSKDQPPLPNVGVAAPNTGP
jgi:hypothetical protein